MVKVKGTLLSGTTIVCPNLELAVSGAERIRTIRARCPAAISLKGFLIPVVRRAKDIQFPALAGIPMPKIQVLHR
jgi:hypothetical protein